MGIYKISTIIFYSLPNLRLDLSPLAARLVVEPRGEDLVKLLWELDMLPRLARLLWELDMLPLLARPLGLGVAPSCTTKQGG